MYPKITLNKAVGVFVGGTSGIGEHTAYTFAKNVTEPTIYILGRSQENATRVLDRLKQANNHKNAKYTFIRTDATLVKDTDHACEQLKAQESRVNLLFLCPGFLTFSGRSESPEGIDTKLAVNYYCRWRFFYQLRPLLTEAAKDPAGAHVSSILAAGTTEGDLPWDDLSLKNSFSLYRANVHIVTCTSSVVQYLSTKYPDIAFCHINPGFVRSHISRDLPFWARVPSNVLMRLVATDPAVAADRFYFHSIADPLKKTGAFILDSRDNNVVSKLQARGVLDGAKEERIWAHTLDVWKQAGAAV